MNLHSTRLASVFGTGLRPVRLVRTEGGRQVWQARDHRGRRLTLIRARSIRAAMRVRREIALLHILEAGDTPAVPTLKWRGVAAYAVAEGPSALAPPRGKRVAREARVKGGSNTAQMASDLAALLKSLHSRGLALGLQGLRGLELSPRGRVVVTDFSHVGPLTPVRKRADQQWLARLTSGAGTYRYAQRRAEEQHEPEWLTSSSQGIGERASASVPAAPIGSRSRHRSAKGKKHRMRFCITSPPRLAAVAVLTCTILAGAPMLASFPDTAPPSTSAPSAHEDPATIIPPLVEARHRYLIGATELNTSAAPGSEAEIADQKLRSALAGANVKGGQVRILEVHALAQNDNAVHVRVRLEDSAARIDGTAQSLELDGSEPYEVDMRLTRIDGEWRIASTTPVGENVESA